jgi:hypothetical protein
MSTRIICSEKYPLNRTLWRCPPAPGREKQVDTGLFNDLINKVNQEVRHIADFKGTPGGLSE